MPCLIQVQTINEFGLVRKTGFISVNCVTAPHRALGNSDKFMSRFQPQLNITKKLVINAMVKTIYIDHITDGISVIVGTALIQGFHRTNRGQFSASVMFLLNSEPMTMIPP